MSRLLARLRRDESGATAVFTGILLMVALGFVGLGVDIGVGYNARRVAQSAADSAAFSAGVGQAAGAINLPHQARAVAARYGLVHGVDGVNVAVNQPPTSGAHVIPQAVEVIITRPSRRFFSSFFSSGATTIRARAVAVSGAAGNGCVVAFNPAAPSTVLENGTPNVNLVGCSLYDNSTSSTGLFLNGTAHLTADKIFLGGNYGTNGNAQVSASQILTNQAPLADPYADVPVPPYSGCNYNSANPTGNTNYSNVGGAPTVFCNGLTLNGNINVNFAPGVYVIDRGVFTVNGNVNVTGTGVTFVLTSSTGSNYATTIFNGNGVTSLSAPVSGPTQGFVFYQDRGAGTGTNTFNGTSSGTFKGALYFPRQQVTFNGTNSTANGGCTQLLADKITFNGTPTLEVNCAGTGVRGIGGHATKLVE